jgi:hypothetical protein
MMSIILVESANKIAYFSAVDQAADHSMILGFGVAPL